MYSDHRQFAFVLCEIVIDAILIELFGLYIFQLVFFFSTTVQSATRSAVNFTLLFGALFQQHPFNFSNQTKYKTDKRNSQRTHFIQSVHARRWKITHIFFFCIVTF